VPIEALIRGRPGNDGRGRAHGLDVQMTRTTAPAGRRQATSCPASDRPELVETRAQSLPLLPTVGARLRF